MSQKRFNALMNIISAILCTVILILTAPTMYNLYSMSSDLGIESSFHWWDKASFIMGPICLFCAIACVGIKGIKDLKSDSDSN